MPSRWSPGYALPHAVRRLDVGGRQLTEHMASILRERAHPGPSSPPSGQFLRPRFLPVAKPVAKPEAEETAVRPACPSNENTRNAAARCRTLNPAGPPAAAASVLLKAQACGHATPGGKRPGILTGSRYPGYCLGMVLGTHKSSLRCVVWPWWYHSHAAAPRPRPAAPRP